MMSHVGADYGHAAILGKTGGGEIQGFVEADRRRARPPPRARRNSLRRQVRRTSRPAPSHTVRSRGPAQGRA